MGLDVTFYLWQSQPVKKSVFFIAELFVLILLILHCLLVINGSHFIALMPADL